MGRGVCAETEPLLMMRPPRGSWAFMMRKASWVHRNGPVKLVPTTACHLSSAGPRWDRRRADAGIVEQQIEPPIGILNLGEQRLHAVRIGDIRGHDKAAALSCAPSAATWSSLSLRRPASATM